jgi:hypothetical protein
MNNSRDVVSQKFDPALTLEYLYKELEQVEVEFNEVKSILEKASIPIPPKKTDKVKLYRVTVLLTILGIIAFVVLYCLGTMLTTGKYLGFSLKMLGVLILNFIMAYCGGKGYQSERIDTYIYLEKQIEEIKAQIENVLLFQQFTKD